MKRLLLALALGCAALALALASSAESQEPTLGQTDPLRAACDYLSAIGELGGLQIKNCRRYGTDVVTSNTALLTVRLATDQGPFVIETRMHKTVWNVSAFITR